MVIKFKSWLYHISHWHHLWICLLVLFIFGLHLGTIMRPDSLMFDEGFYVADARSIIAHEGTLLPQQPALGKLFIVDGIRLFGDNPFGWRFFSVTFGTICIVLFYLICRKLKMSNAAATLATGLFGLENLSFIQASLAMLDVYSFTFMLIALWLFLRGNLSLSGISAALSALIKLPGISVLGIFFLYWLFTGRRQWKTLIVPSLSAAVSFLLLMPLFDYAVSSQLSNPLQQIEYMLNYGSGITFASGYTMGASRPWDWLTGSGAIFYFYDPQYISMLSPTISAFIIPAVLYVVFKAARHDRAALFGALWFACTYLPWIVASAALNRLTYIYYFYPAIGAICIGLGLGLSETLHVCSQNREGKIAGATIVAVKGYLILHLAIFIILSPLAPALVKWLQI